jgi:hypothetical protein
MDSDESGGLFSESLNLWFRWEIDEHRQVRLLRPYLPDGTAITTSSEEHHLRLEAQAMAVEATERRQEAETVARDEAERRQEAEAELEQLRAQLATLQDKDA